MRNFCKAVILRNRHEARRRALRPSQIISHHFREHRGSQFLSGRLNHQRDFQDALDVVLPLRSDHLRAGDRGRDGGAVESGRQAEFIALKAAINLRASGSYLFQFNAVTGSCEIDLVISLSITTLVHSPI